LPRISVSRLGSSIARDARLTTASLRSIMHRQAPARLKSTTTSLAGSCDAQHV
jgi:hypothetical protein